MKRGFTLIELLVLISIILILLLVVVASISTVNEKKDANYIIKHDGEEYYIDSYTKENGGQCVFLSEKELRLCGEFSIEKIEKDNQE